MGGSLQLLESGTPKDWKEILDIETNVKKQEEMIMLISEKMSRRPNFGKTVLAKMMYFSETNHFLQKGIPIAGTIFIKGEYGPVPKDFDAILKRMEKEGLIKIVKIKEAHDRIMILPLRESNSEMFSQQELCIMNDVIARLNNFTAAQMRDYSHKDVAWEWTKEDEEIDYRLVAYREIHTM